MTIEEWVFDNPDITKEQLVQELCEWRDRALKLKARLMQEGRAHADTRKRLKKLEAKV